MIHAVTRLGQEPPPQPAEDSFDGRSLAEVSLSQHGLVCVQESRTTLTLRYWFDVVVETCR